MDELTKLVLSGNFNRLLGETEGHFFDVKSKPYQFDTRMEAKREFAKDFASFANAGGGYVFVGIATKSTPASPGEEVPEIRPLEKALFDIERHRKILAEWLYLQPSDVQLRWTQFGQDGAKGVGVIFVPPQSERSNHS